MIRHHVRWPALVLVAGLILAFATTWSGSAPPPAAVPAVSSGPSGVLPPQAAEGPSVLTDAQGRFRFDGLNHASHLLRVDPQSLPALQAASDQMVLTLSPGVTRSLAVAPGLALYATYHSDGTTLEGVLFEDHNGDGLQSAAELGLAGARVIDPGIFQYYVPFNDDNLWQSFADQLSPNCLNRPADNAILSTISLTGSAPNTIVYYDHWEDGYDADPIVPGPTTQRIPITDGQVQTWQNDIPIPRNPANLLYDGRDRITVVGEPVSAVRAAWLTPRPGSLLAAAWEMPKVSDWGQNYIIPIGEDIGQGGTQPFGDYDYVSASVMAAYDGTVVRVDPNADGVFDPPQTLNAGQTLYIPGSPSQAIVSIRSGAQISASLPVQVQVRAGNCRAAYSGRSYTLVPVERWTNDYWSPVASFFDGQDGCTVRYQPPPVPPQPNASADVDIYIFNPSAAALQVTYEDASGTGLITIPPRSTRSYLDLHPNPLARRSNTQGVHLTAPGPFWAVTAVDSTSLGNNGADFDWSYALIPSKDLSSRVVLSWSPSSTAAPPPPNQNISGSTVYVQAVRDGTVVTVDLDGNGVLDQFDTDGDGVVEPLSNYGYNEVTSNQGVTLNRGQMMRISNPVTHDMAGAIISTQDVRHPLATVYGEDACIANYATPFLDLGYTVLPLPTPTISKNSRLLIDADRSDDISPGDTLEYKIQVYNSGTGPIEDPKIFDTLPYTYTDFIVGSVTSDPVPLPPGVRYDDGSGTFTYVPTAPPGTPDPLIHALTAAYPMINPGDGVVITLRIILARNIPRNVLQVINRAELTCRNCQVPPAIVIVHPNQVDLLACKTDGRTTVNPGDRLTYTITYTNAGPGIAYDAVMTDTLPPMALNVTTVPVPGVITPTIQPGRVIFQLGTLPAGRIGQTTISLTVGPNTPRGTNVINTVDIGTRSHEITTTNNRCADIDRVPSPTAVVLAEFGAGRWPGGVLVHWRTVAELDNYGFRVYRSRTPSRAAAVLVTPQIIPGQGRGIAGGANYNFFDAGAPDGPLYYWLEDIDLNGISEFHGPAQPALQRVDTIIFVPLVGVQP
jgi:uncharacterized repeat protein (TIGR01451 family)